MIIYKITNKLNSKVYVGQTTVSLRHRWRNHICKGNALHLAIKKYGEENFTIEIIDTAESIDELNQKEVEWIAKCDCMAPNGYNLAKGGKGTPGHAHSEESKQKMREAGTGRILPTEWRESISAALTGVKKSEEHAAKVGLAHRGKKLSEEQKQTLRIINTGKTLSEETKSKISAIGKGRRHSEESIEKMKINRALSSGKNFMCIETGEVFFSQRIAAEKLGVKQGHISSVLSGRRKHTKGFTFQYIETTVEGDANVGYE